MTVLTWRPEPVPNSRLAWLYVIPHATTWDTPAAATHAAGYAITEERQNLVDDQFGACLRYLTFKPH